MIAEVAIVCFTLLLIVAAFGLYKGLVTPELCDDVKWWLSIVLVIASIALIEGISQLILKNPITEVKK
jgi:hypothetical protein